MKKPIIKAHASGWLPNDRTDCIDIHNIQIEKDLFYFNARLKINDYNDAPMFKDSEMNLYTLLFATDFIDKLVELEGWEIRTAHNLEMPCKGSCEECLDGDGDKCLVCAHCDTTITEHDDDYWHNNIDGTDLCETCYSDVKHNKGIKPADYHRSVLANLKDIEAIKDYVEGLV